MITVTGDKNEGHIKLFPRQISSLYHKLKKLKVKHSRFQNNLRRKNLLQCQQETLSQFITYLICIKHDNKLYRSVSRIAVLTIL